MADNQKFHSKAWVNKNRGRNGQNAIFIRIYVNRTRAEISTNHLVLLANWDDKKNRVKSNVKNSFQINTSLDRIENELKEHFLFFCATKEMANAQKVKSRYTGVEVVLPPTPSHKTILEAFDYHNTKLEEQVKIGKVVKKTHTRYIITKNKVEAFMKFQCKVDDMPLPDMRLRFVTEFEHYLLMQDKLQSNTAHKYIKNLKKIMNMSVGLDWIPSNPFNNFRCSYTSPEREILTQEELDALRFKKIDILRLAEVRDVFVFCCYTGFAYSDIYNFEYDAVTKGIDGEYWLSTNRQKTGTRESVPLLPVALQIIERYRDHEYCKAENKLLPVNSNQRYNGYLKEIAAICGIKKKITSHIARHTFATTVTMANGVPIETVSAMLGHNSIRTTQIYAKVVEKKVSEDMQNLKAKLFGIGNTNQNKKIG